MLTPREKFKMKMKYLKYKKILFGKEFARERTIPAGSVWWDMELDRDLLVSDLITKYSIKHLPGNIKYELWRRYILPTKIGWAVEDMYESLMSYFGRCPEGCEGMCCDSSYKSEEEIFTRDLDRLDKEDPGWDAEAKAIRGKYG